MRIKAQLWVALILILVSAVPALAGTALVPYAGRVELAGTAYTTRVWATNTAASEARRIEYQMLAPGQDGTVAGASTVVWIDPGQTRVLDVGGATGLLKVFGAPQIVISARLVREGTGQATPDGTQLPVLAPSDLAAAGATLHLQGWERQGAGTAAQTSFGIVNGADTAATCQVGVYRASGASALQPVDVEVPPFSHLHFLDVLGFLGLDNVADMRVSASCDQGFSIFSIVTFPGNGDLVVVVPARAIDADFSGPDEPPPPPPSDQFDYLSDLSWIGVSNMLNGPHKDRSGFDAHHPAGPVGGYKAIQINGVTYNKGISWQPYWSALLSHVTWDLNGAYTRLEMKVRFDDEVFRAYEWGIVDRNTGTFIRLERPPDGYSGVERYNQFRIGSSGTLNVWGDGQLLYTSPEFHAYGTAVDVAVDVTGVDLLTIQFNSTGHEEAIAPYRKGLPNPPALVKSVTWHDNINLADAKLYR